MVITMNKVLLFLLFLIFSTKIFAQLDREHWFAPMFDGQSNSSPYQFLYLSTNETTPFSVIVYSNNNVVYQTTISKGAPRSISISRGYIITNNTSDLHKVGTMGLYAKGDRPFYASLRFGMTNHAEIITSKGTAGIGTKFYTAVVPNSLLNGASSIDPPTMGFGASFLATEDNTTVTVNNFKKTLNFNNYGSATGFTFTLNKGQSYIIDGRSNSLNNKDGFIGATVTSDKPISMSNGSFNGQFSTIADSNSGTDIFMDQSVPVEKLGDEFVIVKGYGKIGNRMEGAVIVATKPNTQIYVNDSSIPIATLANAGDYYTVEETNYIDRGNNHYNLHIKASQNIYVYQMMGGVEDSSAGGTPLATGGMNYIPPLNCYLPKKIDEIGSINVIGSNTFTTKLNIITEKGATVKVNGVVPNSQYGPYDTSSITANQKWVTYSIPNQTGNITVVSDRAVTAGLSGGSVSAGYGGYFAGFSSIPLILKTEGDCLPGVKLAVTEGFTSYQWVIKDNTGAYVPAPGVNNTNTYEPAQAGIYAVIIQQGSCPAIQTQDFKFYNCTTYTNVNYETCSSVDIPPAFSLSTQTLNPATVKIDTPPSKGTAIPQSDGTIKYTANAGASGIDTFKYSYCGDDALPDCEVAQATIQINQIVAQDAILRECASTSTAIYDLTKANVTSDTSVTKVYYKTLIGAQNQVVADVINNFTAYQAADVIVYVRIKNAKNCVAIQKIELKSKAYPVVQENLYTKMHCDEEDGLIDGNYIVNPNDITPIVLTSATTFTVKYYDSLVKADAGGADNITGNYIFTSANAKIWIRVESSEACVTVKEITLNIGNKIPLITNNLIEDVCDKGFDNTEQVDLSTYLPKLTSQTGLAATYYATMPDALNGQNAIPALQTLVMGTTGTFYGVIKNANYCSDVATINLTLIMGGQASTTLPASVPICELTTTTLDAGTAHLSYTWYNENDPTTIIGTGSKIVVGVGKYFVILISANGCEYKQFVEVVGFPKPVLNIAAYNATLCDDNLDGKINLVFSTDVTPNILTNNNSDFNVTYYNNAAMLSTQVLPNAWSFTTDTRVYVKVSSSYCTDVTGFIDFKIGAKIPLLTTTDTQLVCDDDLDGKKLVQNLDGYISGFTSDPTVTAKFYVKKTDAQANASNNVTEVAVNQTQTLYVRLSNATSCPSLAELTIKIKVPKKSDTLKDKTICPDEKTDLDAGIGFSKYEWYRESDPTTMIGSGPIITDLPVDKYYVILTGFSPNDCPYKQKVEIKAAELPTITSIEIAGSTVTINVKGGKEPYKYAIDNGNYQESNIFTDIAPGLHKVYVVSADDCDPVEKEFSVIKIYNLITPNGDGVNDVLDMSLLKYKINVKFEVFNRQGNRLFEGTTNNNYIWDGKQNGKSLPTSSYWYIMQWQDFENSTPVKYSGWILLKNRNTDQ
ncbi:MAG: hypothetical protein DI529_02215 [Chryseobacterium sp.]|nr:MAG: hypothetical protein DI529_02215 [Chryseobacterium sp.]